MQNIGSKIFTVFIIGLLGTLLYLTVFSDGLGQAPSVSVKTSQGQTIQLDKPLKPVLVNFWATSCPGCIKEMPEMAKMKQALGDRFELVAISMQYDPKEQVEKFIANNPYPFTFVMDSDGKLAKAFGDVLLTPTSFLIAPNGRIVYQIVGELQFEQVAERIKRMSPQL
ncbi:MULTISPECIES: peroxiredoxin family protein [Thiomicrorhabdus]|uniref:TlpA family protein disulfide reductase n=1 Tax=Thiomicrorhabdus heinhorstiae TaxID=2748010 RepID=A0ABS0C1P8_9GAMM|nr:MULTISPECIES: TlpA disulfide reductase family protein [Thiomicrorhabdus]MBF6058247.1 TlpA family protein disulfide reductase [Thiomicrorhabdus heinhorstiae]